MNELVDMYLLHVVCESHSMNTNLAHSMAVYIRLIDKSYPDITTRKTKMAPGVALYSLTTSGAQIHVQNLLSSPFSYSKQAL